MGSLRGVITSCCLAVFVIQCPSDYVLLIRVKKVIGMIELGTESVLASSLLKFQE